MEPRLQRDEAYPTSAQESRTLDEQAGACFGCGPANPHGLRLAFTLGKDADGLVTAWATVVLGSAYEGPPGYMHGGIIATVLDEAMSKLNRPLHVLAMTRNLNVDYLRPVPLGISLRVNATHLRREGRKLLHLAELLHPDGTVLAKAQGLFIAIEPGLLERAAR